MNEQQLRDTARALVADDKGLLAMDESNPTCNKRFAKLGIPQTAEARRTYRETIVTTTGLAESISGAILYDETIRQRKNDGTPFARAVSDAGIIPGIKVDLGAKDLAGHPGEKITEGLDGLRERLAEYFQMGGRFAKARGTHLGRWYSHPGVDRGQRSGFGSLCRVVPGSRIGPRRRTRSADGRRPHIAALQPGNGGSPANGLQPTLHAGRDAGRPDPEAQYGVAGNHLPQAGFRG